MFAAPLPGPLHRILSTAAVPLTLRAQKDRGPPRLATFHSNGLIFNFLFSPFSHLRSAEFT